MRLPLKHSQKKKGELLERKVELETLESRKQTALGITSGTITGTVIGSKQPDKETKSIEDKYSTVEYRTAFMEYCKSGKEIPVEYRNDAFTSVSEAAAVIPNYHYE